jgi:hypothetical protein
MSVPSQAGYFSSGAQADSFIALNSDLTAQTMPKPLEGGNTSTFEFDIKSDDFSALYWTLPGSFVSHS